MKRIRVFTAALTVVIFFTSCSKNLPKINYEQSNTAAGIFGTTQPIMETDLGFYYNNSYMNLSLQYHEKGTDSTIYLCAKPECQHDGNSFCTATNKEIKPINMALYDKYIYILALNEKEDKISLYRVSLDGTELTKVTDIAALSAGFNDFGEMIVHRGLAFVTYSSKTSAEHAVNSTPQEGFSAIAVVELSTAKCEVIAEYDNNEYYVDTPGNLNADGDYMYYLARSEKMEADENGKWSKFLKHYLIRYNIKSKTSDEYRIDWHFTDGYKSIIADYQIINGDMWYLTEGDYSIYNNGTTKPQSIYIHNFDKDETKEFAILPNDINSGRMIFDGTYLYLEYSRRDNRSSLYEYFMYDLFGNKLSDFLYSPEIGNNEFYHSEKIRIINDKIYLNCNIFDIKSEHEGTLKKRHLISCSVENIKNGNFEWTAEFEYRDLVFRN